MSDSRLPSRRGQTRRGLLGLLGTVGLAGCVSVGGGSSDGGTPTATRSATSVSTTATERRGSSTETPRGTESPGRTETPQEPDTARQTTAETTRRTATEIHSSYETTTVDVRTPSGELLGSVTAAIADTPELRYLGLSDTPSMPDDRGMLFVYDSVSRHTFVMRRMSFGLDIVYADDEGVITRIHHAPKPGPDENGNNQRYPGRGQYVLEVNIDWTTEHGVTEGDVLDFSL